ncbi:hypothetical protein PG911_10505 [Tenacibaculum ovolyticum]|uniref:PulJ/GspJ family protein n=1 Tax=Tenacibaculum ovolyticum TaxID=104270 RepID=UPI0022F3CDD2|nr:hypothetical protein [Tenacibaculum ovolyticum]WBX75088.1 hypothetical protein PG911_10505 [Tenacibaculum ovolyticum]
MRGNKLKSYTIIEILISMLMMSIVVLITYVLFSSVIRQSQLFIKTEETLLAYVFFKNTLKREVFESKQITVINNKISLKFKKQIIDYTFDENFIYRKDSRIGEVDTIFLKLKKIEPFFLINSKEKNIKNYSQYKYF